MSKGYNDWVQRVMAEKETVTLENGEVVKTSAAEPFKVTEYFIAEPRDKYYVEVAKRGNDFIFHFYPADGIANFFDELSEALVEAFKRSEQIEAAYSEELGSWAVKASGFVNTVWGDELAMRALSLLDERLE